MEECRVPVAVLGVPGMPGGSARDDGGQSWRFWGCQGHSGDIGAGEGVRGAVLGIAGTVLGMLRGDDGDTAGAVLGTLWVSVGSAR